MSHKLKQSEITARKNAARAKGEKKYWGDICKKHPDLNGIRILDGNCCECSRLAAKKRIKKWRNLNPEKNKKTQAKSNKRLGDIGYYKKPKISAYRKKYAAEWHQKNKAKRLMQVMARKALQDKAIISKLFISELEKIYMESQRLTMETGIRHEVDHIIPIKHDLVCGLHVPWNLQILTRLKNRSKGNKFNQ